MSRISKLHESIVSSSIWNETDATRIVWVTMLAIRDHRGFVGASVGGLAHLARVTIEACEIALQKFLSPDPDSRTKSDEGRRIKPVDGGWQVLNHEKYASMKDETGAAERKAESSRERSKRYRERKAKAVTPRHAASRSERDESRSVTPRHATSVTPNAQETAQPPLFSLESETAKNAAPTAAENERKKRLPTSDGAKAIAAIFHRRLTTAWSKDEITAFLAIGDIDLADLDLIATYYEAERAKGEEGRHRRDLKTFLNNYHGELDRARLVAPKKQKAAAQDPDGWREFLADESLACEPFQFAPSFRKTDFAKWRKNRPNQ